MSISYTLDKRCTEILNIVMYTTGYLKIQDLADDLEVSKRSVYYDISKINEWLIDNGIDPIIQERGKGIILHKEQVQAIQKTLNQTNAKASNCSLNWVLMKNSTSKFLLLTWRKTNQALLTRSHLVSHTIKLMISLREKPLMLKRKPLSKAGGIRQLISATCQLLFLMTFGNKRIAPDDSEPSGVICYTYTLRKSKPDAVNLI